MAEKIDYSQGIYDAKQLGTPRLLILGAQHMFAMFGATVLVPLLTGLSVSTTLLCAGLGTLLFHFLCKGKVPAFLGSSFAYLGGFTIVTNGGANPENLPYACAAVALSGLPKQEYCYRKCMEREVVVQPSPRVYKALKDKLAMVLNELRKNESTAENSDLLDTINLITATLGGIKGGEE